jgi:hypothetical protein
MISASWGEKKNADTTFITKGLDFQNNYIRFHIAETKHGEKK